MDEIYIPKRFLIIGLLLLALVAAVVWGAPWLAKQIGVQANNLPAPAMDQQAQPVIEDDAAREAAVAGALAFYSIDAQAGQQDWLNRLCAVSTQTGCTVYQNVIGPNLWPEFEQAKTSTSVEITGLEKVSEQTAASRGNAPMQTWRMQIQLSAPWPMQPEPITLFPALALVIQENGAWKFERFLTEDELKAVPTTEAQP